MMKANIDENVFEETQKGTTYGWQQEGHAQLLIFLLKDS